MESILPLRECLSLSLFEVHDNIGRRIKARRQSHYFSLQSPANLVRLHLQSAEFDYH